MWGFSGAFIFGTIGSYIEVWRRCSTTFNAEHESGEIELVARALVEWKDNDILEKCNFLRK